MDQAKILVVRHGQDEDNANHILNGHRQKPLTPLGRQQARQVAGRLNEMSIDRIYTSPLQRTKETATIIAEKLATTPEVIEHPLLIERDFGVLTGKPLSAIPEYATELLETDRVIYFLNAEGAETFPQVLKRLKTFIEEMHQKHPGETVLAVTHGDAGKMLRAAYYHWDWKRGLQTPYVDNTDIIKLAPPTS